MLDKHAVAIVSCLLQQSFMILVVFLVSTLMFKTPAVSAVASFKKHLVLHLGIDTVSEETRSQELVVQLIAIWRRRLKDAQLAPIAAKELVQVGEIRHLLAGSHLFQPQEICRCQFGFHTCIRAIRNRALFQNRNLQIKHRPLGVMCFVVCGDWVISPATT